jgi:AAA domain (dynein-related subfamily)
MGNVETATAIALAAGVPVLIWGGPGVGKTSAITNMVRGRGWPIEVVIASIREPSDFAGLPMIESGGVKLAPPLWAQRAAAAGTGVVFLDELSTAPPAVQAALLRVVLERAVGDLKLPPEVRIVAAANPTDQAADGWDLAPPLANRFCHLEWVLDPQAWAQGSVAGFEATRIPHLDLEHLYQANIRSMARIAGFISARPEQLHDLPTNETLAGHAWPSPRSWTMAGLLVAAAELVVANASVVSILLAGCVGPTAAAQFLSWWADSALPDPEAVLADPDGFVLPERADRAYAALTSVTAAVVANNSAERWEAGWRALMAAMRSGKPDLAVVAVRTLMANRPSGSMPPRDVLMAMTPVLRDAGLLDAITGTTALTTSL